MVNLAERFKKAVEAEMARQGLSQKDLATKMGVQAPNVSRLLGAGHSPRLDTVESIAKALGIEPWKLLRDAGATLGEINETLNPSVSDARRDLLDLVAGMNENEVSFALESLEVLLRGLRGEPLRPADPAKKMKQR